MLEALITSLRSPDPNTQVGACIVNPKNRIVASGYNALPNGMPTGSINWARSGPELETKYPYVVHAEKNAIYNAVSSVEGCTLYVTMYPCNECAKDIIQAGIVQVVYLTNPYKDGWQAKASQRMFEMLDLKVVEHKWEQPDIVQECLRNLLNLVQ